MDCSRLKSQRTTFKVAQQNTENINQKESISTWTMTSYSF